MEKLNLRLCVKCVLLLMLFSTLKSKASKINASTFGYNPTNASAALVAAITSPFDTIIFTKQSADWIINPTNFRNLNNKVIIFQKGVIIRAAAGAYNDEYECLLRFKEGNNITIIGYQAELKMNKAEYAALPDAGINGERHALFFFNCENVIVKGLSIQDSGGDGIYIGGDRFGQAENSRTFSKNVLLEDIKSSGNFRQGMSVLSVENMLVKNCHFTKTGGTLPEAGVDVEPYLPYQRIVNLVFDHCSFTENGYSGITLALSFLNANSLPVSIQFKDCYLKNNRTNLGNIYSPGEITVFSSTTGSSVKGSASFERCFVDGSNWSAVYSTLTADSYKATFQDCVFKDVSKTIQKYNSPINLEIPSYDIPLGNLGNIDFKNVYVSTTNPIQYLGIFGSSNSPGLANITGNITIVQPNNNGISYLDVGSVRQNFTLISNSQTSLPQTKASLISVNSANECGLKGKFWAVRLSNRVNYPLGVSIDTSGSVTYGDDVNSIPKGLIIPANSILKTEEINARKDGINEPLENVNIKLIPSTLYEQYSNNSKITIKIINCNVGSSNVREGIESSKNKTFYNESSVMMFPNPVNNKVMIKSEEPFENAELIITNVMGLILKNEKLNGEIVEINLEQYMTGSYFFTIKNQKGKIIDSHKIIKIAN